MNQPQGRKNKRQMFIAKKSHHFNFRFTGMMINGGLRHLSNANNVENMFNFGEDHKYFFKNIERNKRSNFNTIYTLVDRTSMFVQVRLEDRKYVMDINVIVANGTNDIKNALYKMAIELFEDWVYFGALNRQQVNTFAWQAGVAPLSRLGKTTFVNNGILE